MMIDGRLKFPFGGISGCKTVYRDETGKFIIYDADEHGFNNPAGVWTAKQEITLVGDFFIHAGSVDDGKDIASLLRDSHHTINLE